MRKLTILLIAALAALSVAEYVGVDEISDQLLKLANDEQTEEDKEIFDKMVKMLSLPSHIYRTGLEEYSPHRLSLTCLGCRAVFRAVIALTRRGLPDSILTVVATLICRIFNIQTAAVCRGVIRLNVPIIVHIIRNQPDVNASSFCGLVFQTNTEGECRLRDDRFEFTVDIPEPTGAIPVRKASGQPLKIVHLSDAHIDPLYEPNGVANCNEPVCCRVGQQASKEMNYEIIDNDDLLGKSILRQDSDILLNLDYADELAEDRDKTLRLRSKQQRSDDPPAGYWGDYRNCDSPIWAFEDGVDHAAENNQDADFVYYTGDTIDHGVWMTTYQLIRDSIEVTTDKMKAAFPNTPVYGILGNHEAQPTNQFAPASIIAPNLSTKWVYDFTADQWSKWLPADAQETFRRGGYYTVVPRPGFRIIALNTNIPYRFNWWLAYDAVDPDGQLQWLVDTLFEAEQNGELVHILSHIPPGTHEFYPAWSRELRKIMDRFKNTIAAEFNGHTHTDEFKVFYSVEDPSVATTVAWNGAAMTSYSRYNPNYKVFSIDDGTYEPLDIDTYAYNLTEANLTPDQRPRWFKSYSFKEMYGLDSLEPQEIHNLVQRMASRSERHLLHKYIRHFGKESDLYLESLNWCNEDCEINHLCKMVTTELWNTDKCNEIREVYSRG